ncbi:MULTISPECIES: Panacea domain-containing protein [Acinetobacter]|uniref:Panacea domain-containing protein n=1 Tax=Acinetobacter TaxID=469 RepID=UPI000948FF95|nr:MULTISPECIES: Panacea domain-containing protein [Acinetobacter]
MNRLIDVIAFFCISYPYPSELSDARLTKMVYLADWFYSLAYEEQITQINWYFNHYGPYVDDIYLCAKNHNDKFQISYEQTAFGSVKTVIQFIGSRDEIILTTQVEKILYLVIEKTKSMYFNEFIEYVYSTYPIKSKERYAFLDLPKLANQYKKARF